MVLVTPSSSSEFRVSHKALLFLKKLFIYLVFCLFLAALDLCCFAWAFSSCGDVVCQLLIMVASLIAEHGF